MTRFLSSLTIGLLLSIAWGVAQGQPIYGVIFFFGYAVSAAAISLLFG